MSEPVRRVVVVGGGLAGVSVCAGLRERGFDGELSLVDAQPWLPYDRPPLSKDYLRGKVGFAELLLKPEIWYDQQSVSLRLGAAAVALRPGDGEVALAGGGVLRADRVVLATGGRARPLTVPGGDDPAVHVLRDLADADALRAVLTPGARVVVIGAGLIGAEVSATAVALGCAVTLVDPVATPLAQAVGEQVAQVLHAQHAAHGVELVAGGVARVDRAGGALSVTVSNGRILAADVIVAGIGISVGTSLAEGAGLAVDGGVLVNAGGRTSHPHVYAAGDTARRHGPDGALPRAEHWDAARRGGEVVAAAVLGQPAPPSAAPWFWSDRYDTHLEVAGEISHAAETVVRGELGGGEFTVFGLRDGRCVAAVAVNRSRDIRAAQRLIDRGIPVRAGELADEGVDLRRLLRG